MKKRETTHTTPQFVRSNSGKGWRLDVWVQPGAKRSGTAGLYQGCLKVRLNAPAVDNKANKALVSYVAETLGLKKKQVSLKSGQTNRRKVLALDCGNEPDWELLAS